MKLSLPQEHFVPAGIRSFISFVYQRSMLPALDRSAKCWTDSADMRFFPQLSQRKDGMGTPQERWRERHQSGLVSTMLRKRDSPHAGTHLVSSTKLSPFCRSPL